MDREVLIGVWWDCICGVDKFWVLFVWGICVIFMQLELDFVVQVWVLLVEWGVVQVGMLVGDFGVIILDNGCGWVVIGYYLDIFIFVFCEELEEDVGELFVGMYGCFWWGEDVEVLVVIYVEDW